VSVHKLPPRDSLETSRGPVDDWRYFCCGITAVLPIVIAIIVIKFWGG